MPQKVNARSMLSMTLWIAVIVVASLLLLSFIPEVTIGAFHFKKIDMLSDLRPTDAIEKKKSPDTTTTIIPKVVKKKEARPKVDFTTIQDFNKEGAGIEYFIKALGKASYQPVRIAFFGDSFIEGDIITASLRDSLQGIFGGNGVGLVPMATETAGFRKSIKHTYANWTIHSIITTDNENIPLGISGYSYVPMEANTATYKPGKIPLQQNFKKVRLFYQSKEKTSLHYTINDEAESIHILDSAAELNQFTINHNNIESLQLHIDPTESTYMYGASFEDKNGIYIDNFSMRRNSGLGLAKLSPDLLKQFNRFLDYKLIILQYGLNVASETDSSGYEWYSGKMISLINRFKSIFPTASFLLLSVSDRGVNKDGAIVTMDAITKLRNTQREIARKCGIAYWDMFEAMGGKNSIAKYSEAKPPLAAKDYTHLTHLGGDKLGLKLASALLYEYENYDR